MFLDLHRLQGISASFEAAVLPVQKDEVSAASGGGYSSRLRHRAQFTRAQRNLAGLCQLVARVEGLRMEVRVSSRRSDAMVEARRRTGRSSLSCERGRPDPGPSAQSSSPVELDQNIIAIV